MDKVIPEADDLLVCLPTFEAHIDMLSQGRANNRCRQEQVLLQPGKIFRICSWGRTHPNGWCENTIDPGISPA